MAVRAKMVVNTKTTYMGNAESVKLSPVYGNTEENKQFYASTPSGALELSGIHKAVADQFELGKEYYIDFTPAE